MNNELKAGMKCIQVKPIEEYEFDYVGTEFNITKVTDAIIAIERFGLGKGGITPEEFDKYFEIVENINNTTINDNEIKVELDKTYIIQDENSVFNNIKGKAIFYNEEKNKVILSLDNSYEMGVNVKHIKLVEKTVHKENFIDTKIYNNNTYNIKVKIRDKRTKVTLTGYDIKSSVYCSKNDEYDKNEGIDRAFKKCIIKLLHEEIEILHTDINK